jgi:hypothetical protein
VIVGEVDLKFDQKKREKEKKEIYKEDKSISLQEIIYVNKPQNAI